MTMQGDWEAVVNGAFSKKQNDADLDYARHENVLELAWGETCGAIYDKLESRDPELASKLAALMSDAAWHLMD